MKKKFVKTLIASVMCICMVVVMSSNIFAVNIPITTGSNYESGSSHHVEYTYINSVRGYSEGNCLHFPSDNICVYAYVSSNSYGGNTYVKYLNVDTRNSGYGRVNYAELTKTTSGVIEWDETVDFMNRSLYGYIYIEENSYSPVNSSDRWNAEYRYYWDGENECIYGGEYFITYN